MEGITTAHSMSFIIPGIDFKRKNACSIDFGGSVIKMTYASEEADGNIKINCVSFLQDHLKSALIFLKSSAPNALANVSKINTCGIGCHIHENIIKDILGVGVQNQSEFECFVQGFRHLSENLPLEDFVFPERPPVQNYTKKYKECMEMAEACLTGEFKSNLEIWKFSERTGIQNPFSDSSSSSSSEDEDDVARVIRQQNRRARKATRRLRREIRRQAREQKKGSTISPQLDGAEVRKAYPRRKSTKLISKMTQTDFSHLDDHSESEATLPTSGEQKKSAVPHLNSPYPMPGLVDVSSEPIKLADTHSPIQKRANIKGKQNYVTYPALLLMCGSGGTPIYIKKNGKYNVLDINTVCGRFFLGLGSLLTGAKNFSELIQLAEKGDSGALNVAAKHLKQDDGADFYSVFPGELVVYGMGHAVGKDPSDFKKEDLAAATIATVALSLAQSFQVWSMALNIKKVFFCGSFPSSSQVIRDEISKNFSARSIVNPFGKATEHYFIRCGAYVGCLGAMFMSMKTGNEENKQ